MPAYTIDQLDDFEEAAEKARPTEQKAALAFLAGLFARNRIEYGVMGGMNFHLRGSPRTTGDVDIAIDNKPRTEALLAILDKESRIWWPKSKMQWASGVVRIFVDISGQLVQFDLKAKGSEGHLIPRDIAGSVDRMRLSTSSGQVDCNILSIGPLVAAKIKAHYGREIDDDYIDLKFVCRHPTYKEQVRAAARSFRPEWKECFLERVIAQEPRYEQDIRWALDMPRSPSPPRGQGRSSAGSPSSSRIGDSSRSGESSSTRRSGKAKSTAGGSTSTASSSAPRDGEKSKDGYWTYSTKYSDWYHKHSNGQYSWAKGRSR